MKHLPASERPRERLMKYGDTSLSNRELLAILLGSGTRKYPVMDLAEKLLSHFQDSLISLAKASPCELQQIPGIGPVKSLELRAAFALVTRLSEERLKTRSVLNTPQELASFLQGKFRTSDQEEFYVITLNPHLEMVHCEKISQGLIDRCLVHAREVFHMAIQYKACNIIISHNHPSGIPQPSDEDIKITRELYLAGKIIGITLLDHIIIGEKSSQYPKGYVSLREEQLPPFDKTAS